MNSSAPPRSRRRYSWPELRWTPLGPNRPRHPRPVAPRARQRPRASGREVTSRRGNSGMRWVNQYTSHNIRTNFPPLCENIYWEAIWKRGLERKAPLHAASDQRSSTQLLCTTPASQQKRLREPREPTFPQGGRVGYVPERERLREDCDKSDDSLLSILRNIYMDRRSMPHYWGLS